VKVRDVIKLIEQDGWYLVRMAGSHRHYKHPNKPGAVTVPGHPGKDMPGGYQEHCIQAGKTKMSEALRYAVVFERSEDGYGAYVPDLPGCVTVGDTLAETEANIREAIAGHISVLKEFGDVVPQPTTLTEYIEIPLAVRQ
jgi:predicted RNA binding protein YcfA (HicA-like mRNA interferase family)/predicted RNase H-like HicB family nuclease